MENEAAYLMALNSLDGIGPVGAVSIAKKFKTQDELTGASESDIVAAVGERIGRIISSRIRDRWDSQLKRSQARVSEHLDKKIFCVAYTADAYPPLLKLISDPPPVLFVKGNLKLLKVLDTVAIIGTRNATSKGLQVANRVSRYFIEAKFVTVSGLARGIDAEAHRAALDTGATIGVLANSLDHVYPAENRYLASQIVNTGGALVSEMSLGEKTFKNAFVRRDRIQSGMSLAVIPIQTDVEGGTMHTVRYAENQKRLLFCPSPLKEEGHCKQYAGIWLLIRSQRAKEFQSKDYLEVVSQIRDYKLNIVEKYHLRETAIESALSSVDPFITRSPVVPAAEFSSVAASTHHSETEQEDLFPTENPSITEVPNVPNEAALQALESTFRQLGLHLQKEAFNLAVTKIRARLFKPTKDKRLKKNLPPPTE